MTKIRAKAISLVTNGLRKFKKLEPANAINIVRIAVSKKALNFTFSSLSLELKTRVNVYSIKCKYNINTNRSFPPG